jgi:hypothetical protein
MLLCTDCLLLMYFRTKLVWTRTAMRSSLKMPIHFPRRKRERRQKRKMIWTISNRRLTWSVIITSVILYTVIVTSVVLYTVIVTYVIIYTDIVTRSYFKILVKSSKSWMFYPYMYLHWTNFLSKVDPWNWFLYTFQLNCLISLFLYMRSWIIWDTRYGHKSNSLRFYPSIWKWEIIQSL